MELHASRALASTLKCFPTLPSCVQRTALATAFWGRQPSAGVCKPVARHGLRQIHNQPGPCEAAILRREQKQDFLAGVHRDHTDLVAKILDQAASAADRWAVAHTDFLPPPAREDAMMALGRMADVAVLVSGGYPQAERARLSVGSREALEAQGALESGEGYPGAVACLSVSGNFMFDPAVHGDFLGAVLGTGITREKVGDIIVQGDRGAQVLVDPELVPFLSGALIQVRTVAVRAEEIPLAALQVRTPRVDVVKSVESSLRVDALASAGFRISRSKLVDMISGGEVRVNWKEVTKGGFTLKSGDVISVRGKGRLEVGEITTTKKGKYCVEINRFL